MTELLFSDMSDFEVQNRLNLLRNGWFTTLQMEVIKTIGLDWCVVDKHDEPDPTTAIQKKTQTFDVPG